MTAVLFPQLVPKVYGLLFSFGVAPTHPGVIIVERLTGLDEDLPDETVGIANNHLFASRATGELLVVDPRFPTLKKPAQEDIKLSDIFQTSETETWLGNLGVDSAGRLYLLDSGNASGSPNFNNRNSDFTPVIDLPGVDQWKPCLPLSKDHLAQTKAISDQMFSLYLTRLAASERTAPPASQAV